MEISNVFTNDYEKNENCDIIVSSEYINKNIIEKYFSKSHIYLSSLIDRGNIDKIKLLFNIIFNSPERDNRLKTAKAYEYIVFNVYKLSELCDYFMNKNNKKILIRKCFLKFLEWSENIHLIKEKEFIYLFNFITKKKIKNRIMNTKYMCWKIIKYLRGSETPTIINLLISYKFIQRYFFMVSETKMMDI